MIKSGSRVIICSEADICADPDISESDYSLGVSCGEEHDKKRFEVLVASSELNGSKPTVVKDDDNPLSDQKKPQGGFLWGNNKNAQALDDDETSVASLRITELEVGGILGENNNNQEDSTTKVCPDSYRNDDFFGDSPYFDAFVNKEMDTVAVVTETMNDIANKTEAFARNGLQMANATRQLASSCKLDITSESTPELLSSKRKAMEPEVVEGLERLGDVLDEMASAQEHLCRFLMSYMVSNMQSIAANDTKTQRMLDETRNETEEAEEMLLKYCRGAKDSWGSSLDGIKKWGEGSGQGSMLWGSIDGGSGHNKLMNRRSWSTDLPDSPDDTSSSQLSIAKATQVARWKHDLVRVRAIQTSAQLKRYQLATHIIHSKYQQNVDISKSADQMVGEMCTYFSNCSNLVATLRKRTTSIKAKCNELQKTNENRHWGQREDVLHTSLSMARQAELDSELEVRAISRADVSTLEPSSCEFDIHLESEHIWDLPATLASFSGHSRRTAKGVLAEGWLNRRSGSSIRSNKLSWSRGWYLVKKEGVFALQSCTGHRRDSKNNKNSRDEEATILEKIKLCDLHLCSVREMKEVDNDPSTRFCFELITPTNYKERVVLQARGPYEYKMWLDAIRLGISTQLAAGDTEVTPKTAAQPAAVPVRAENQTSLLERFTFKSSGVPAKTEPVQRMTSEIASTVLDRGRSLFSRDDPSLSETTETGDDFPPEVKQLMKSNPICADCRMRSPDWVSLNLGILICLECSGVHRSLGVHISKVRSLSLDALSHRESRLLLSLGNKCVNQYWEKEVSEKVPNASVLRRSDRENWIRRKYVDKEFIGSHEGSDEEDASRSLYQASKRADVIGVAKAIIYGGDVNWKNPDEENNTALEVCGAIRCEHKEKIVACQELLFQSGANPLGDESSCSYF